MRWILSVVALASGAALAQSDDCTTLRRALSIAQQAGVDTGDLSRLERQRCQSTPASTGATCQHLDAFLMLALATGADSDITGTLEAQRGVWCNRSDEPTRTLQWSNGSTLRTSSGTFYWPSGAQARGTSGTWFASTGATVKSPSGTLYYPSGQILRSSSGRVHLPSGEQTDEGRLAALACRAETQWCRFYLDAGRGAGTRQDFALLGLGLLAGRAD
jgi:hypothetical protein